jgi:acyl carrier protein
MDAISKLDANCAGGKRREPDPTIVSRSAGRLQSRMMTQSLDGVLTEQVLSALVKVKPGLGTGITPESTLESLGLDSLDTITLMFELESRAGVSIPDEEVRSIKTVGDIIERIRRLKDSASIVP